jgi:UDP:flavonoid glycosyltransferase YjiC (YdhE family)
VACHGGGRHRLGDRDAAEVFADAATLSARSGMTTLAVAAPARSPALRVDALPNAELMAVLAGAEAALLAGGSLLVQALALGTPFLALPMQAEQAARVDWLSSAGAVQAASDADPTALAAALAALAGDAGRRQQLREASRALGLENGLPDAVAALQALLQR